MQPIQELDGLRAAIGARLGAPRFRHTLGVEETAARLGEIYLPHSIRALRIAALLHDLTKEWSGEEQLAYCEKHCIPITQAERAAPRILHAKTAAHLAAREFSAYTDREILDAIARHTVGAANLTVFDGIIYLADYIEPTREYPECCHLRDAFYSGLASCGDETAHFYTILLRAFRESVAEVKGRGGIVADETVGAIAFLEAELKKRAAGV